MSQEKGKNGNEWTRNDDGTLSPIDHPQLVLGFGETTRKCPGEANQPRQDLGIFAKGSPNAVVAKAPPLFLHPKGTLVWWHNTDKELVDNKDKDRVCGSTEGGTCTGRCLKCATGDLRYSELSSTTYQHKCYSCPSGTAVRCPSTGGLSVGGCACYNSCPTGETPTDKQQVHVFSPTSCTTGYFWKANKCYQCPSSGTDRVDIAPPTYSEYASKCIVKEQTTTGSCNSAKGTNNKMVGGLLQYFTGVAAQSDSQFGFCIPSLTVPGDLENIVTEKKVTVADKEVSEITPTFLAAYN